MKYLLSIFLLFSGVVWGQVTENFDDIANDTELAADANWTTAFGSIKVYNNTGTDGSAYSNTAGNDAAVYYDGTFDADQYAEGTLTIGNSSSYAGLGVRCSANNGYIWYAGTAGSYLDKIVNGTWSELAYGYGSFSTNDVLRLEIEGTEIRCYRNGVLDDAISGDGIVTDASISSGNPAVSGYNANVNNRIDDWEGGDLTPSAYAPPQFIPKYNGIAYKPKYDGITYYTKYGGIDEPESEEFEFLFFTDFENEELGYYSSAEADAGFANVAYGYKARLEECEIVNNYIDGTPSKMFRFNYPANAYSSPFQTGGEIEMYLDSLKVFDSTTWGQEMYVSYDVKFMPGFQFRYEGKLPGLMGTSPEWGSEGCAMGDNWFISRAVWKWNGMPAFYCYWPESWGDYDFSCGGNAFQWGNPDPGWLDDTKANFVYNHNDVPFYWSEFETPDSVHHLTFRIVMNSFTGEIPDTNGIMEGWCDGVLISQVEDMLFRTDDGLYLNWFRFATHMGGMESYYAPTQDQWMDVDNVAIWKYRVGQPGIPYGNTLSQTSRTVPIIRSQ